jgi:hypothetical protein
MTLQERTTEAFVEAYSEALLLGRPRPLHTAIGEVLTHIGGELLVMDTQRPGIRAHQAAHHLFDATRTLEVDG